MHKNYLPVLITGIFIMIITWVITFSPFFKSDIGRLINGAFGIIARISAAIITYKTAKKQKRNVFLFPIFSLILPGISLMIISALGDKEQKSN